MKKKTKQKMKNKIRACAVLVCQYVVIFYCNVSFTNICQLTQFNYRLIYNTCTCLKPSEILLKFGIKVASYVLYCIVFFLVIFSVTSQSGLIVWNKQEHFKNVRSESVRYPTFPSIILFFFFFFLLQDAAQGIYNIFFLDDRYESVS